MVQYVKKGSRLTPKKLHIRDHVSTFFCRNTCEYFKLTFSARASSRVCSIRVTTSSIAPISFQDVVRMGATSAMVQMAVDKRVKQKPERTPTHICKLYSFSNKHGPIHVRTSTLGPARSESCKLRSCHCSWSLNQTRWSSRTKHTEILQYV
jgi:hypothetical protein